MSLDGIRKEISHIDAELLLLIHRRMELAVETRRFKTEIIHPEREQEVFSFVQRSAHGLVGPEFSRRLFAEIICESRRLQAEDYLLVGFQGEHGAYGEAAARRYLPEAACIPCRTFAQVFEGVASGSLDRGVVPLENYLGGVVAPVSELLVDSKLVMVGEIRFPVRHCLLVPPGTHHRDIRVVYSHPQALAQCREFLRRHNLEARPFYDTAGAARMLFQDRPEASAAIAGLLCADLYHLDVIGEAIEDHPDNITRFAVLAREAMAGGGDKTSIIFSTAHRAGTLYRVLQVFADRGVNLTRIE
ncbi:MAG: chorismate mutase, partial [Acidobacteria bacterium]|nr:chorismate mutase [Acidobacteriota bacterium]